MIYAICPTFRSCRQLACHYKQPIDAARIHGRGKKAGRSDDLHTVALVAVVPDQDQNQGRDRGHALLDRNLVVTATTKETIPNPGTVAPVQGNQSPVVIVAAGAEAGAGIVLRIAALVAVVRATVRTDQTVSSASTSDPAPALVRRSPRASAIAADRIRRQMTRTVTHVAPLQDKSSNSKSQSRARIRNVTRTGAVF